jgi:hypothetical protein
VISLKALYLFLSVFVLFWVFSISCLVLFLSLVFIAGVALSFQFSGPPLF